MTSERSHWPGAAPEVFMLGFQRHFALGEYGDSTVWLFLRIDFPAAAELYRLQGLGIGVDDPLRHIPAEMASWLDDIEQSKAYRTAMTGHRPLRLQFEIEGL